MHRIVWTSAAACVAALCAGCGGGGGGDRDGGAGSTSAAKEAATAGTAAPAREPFANTDAAGRAQRVPAAERIDVGGDRALRPFVLAAKSISERATPGFTVTVDASSYGSNAWGLCLGSSEVAALGDRQGWGTGLEGCEKTGIFITSLPVARGAWLAVGSRAAMRPEVEAYVDRSIDAAPAAARAAGLAPLSPAALARTHGQWKAFVRRFRAAGTQPMVG